MNPENQATAGPLSSIPALGSGIGFRRELKQDILDARDEIDFIEVVTEQYLTDSNQLTELEELRDIFPIVPHGVRLSIGSAALDQEYLRAIKLVSDTCRAPYYSEHLAVTRAPGIEIGHLSPLWFTEAVLEQTVNNVLRVQDTLGKPLILENITYLFDIPRATMTQTEFLGRLVESTGCGILLDLTNLYTNATNHDFDPLAALDGLPLDKVVQLHLAGGYWSQGILIDAHCEPVAQGTWALLEALANRVQVKACILEHDDNFPDHFSVLSDQVRRAREFVERRRVEEPYGP